MKSKALLIIFFIMGCATVYNPATQRQEVYFIDDKAEVAIGRNMAEEIKRESELVRDPYVLSRLIRVGNRVARASDRDYLDYRFHILNKEGMNAFALPGGFIFVNKGLLDNATEDELAFVLAHEIGHVAARHAIKRLQASLGMNLILSIAFQEVRGDTVKGAVDILYNVVALGYSRQDEFLAVSLAVTYTHKAGYDPGAGVSLMQKLESKQDDDFTLVFLRSHPPVEQRIKNIEEKIEELE